LATLERQCSSRLKVTSPLRDYDAMTSAVLYTLFPAAATVVGAAVALYRRPGDAAMRVIHHFTAGIVFAAAATEILPDLKQQSPVAVLLGGAGGWVKKRRGRSVLSPRSASISLSMGWCWALPSRPAPKPACC
jgi:hypothetical protein